MMTTLRSDRRTRRNATFNLEYLDDRIVLSAAGAKAHIAAMISSAHARAAEKAAITLERHDAHLAKVQAKTDAMEHFTPSGPAPRPTTPIVITGGGSPQSSSLAKTDAMGHYTPNGPAPRPTTPIVITGGGSPQSSSPPTTATPSSTANPAAATSTQSSTTSTSSNAGSSSTLPANLSAQLQSLYTQYESYVSSGGSGTFSPTGVNGLVISGTNVGINFQTSDSAEFGTALSQLQSDGLQVTTDSATYGIIDGMVSIAQLPAIAQISSSASVTPIFQPTME